MNPSIVSSPLLLFFVSVKAIISDLNSSRFLITISCLFFSPYAFHIPKCPFSLPFFLSLNPFVVPRLRLSFLVWIVSLCDELLVHHLNLEEHEFSVRVYSLS